MDTKLNDAFAALATYDWGKDSAAVLPIDDAVVAAHGHAEARKALEARLVESLKSSPPRAARDYICRKLMLMGTAESVPALALLLPDKDHSHMARYALERMQCSEAAAALREALPKVSGTLRVGVIGSLGARRDGESVGALASLLGDADKQVAGAAACALGDIASPDAAKALGRLLPKSPDATAVTDACLACAEGLLADGKKTDAIAMYKLLGKTAQAKHIRLAATRGLLAASKKK